MITSAVSANQPWLLGLLIFALASSITPGPNNILLASSGARFGIRRTLPHASGIWAGMVTLLGIAALGLGALATAAPALVTAMQIAAAFALLWTAFGMVRPRTTNNTETMSATEPWSFWQGLGFQYLNPKALMMAVTAVALTPLVSTPSATTAAVAIAAFMVISMPCTWVWVLMGAAMRKALTSPARQKMFNWCMATLLVATIPLSLMPSLSIAK